MKTKAVGGITTTYSAYDGLNRVTGKSYSDNKTFSVAYVYDASPNGIGRLTSVTATDPVLNQTYKTSYDSYDTQGRVLQSTQTTTGSPYVFHHAYDVAGDLELVQYPSGRQVQTCYTSSGRINTVSNPSTGGLTYATVNHYTPHGAIAQMTLGNSLIESTTFNKRLQSTQIQAGSLLTLNYSYCNSLSTTDCTTNNGNLRYQSIYDGTTTRTQTYTYDPVDRLVSAAGDSIWSQSYVYDVFGNRSLLSSSSDPSTGLALVLRSVTTSEHSVPFSSSMNRWTFSGATYDNGTGNGPGNLTGVQLDQNDSFQATYDAENRQTSVTGTVQGSASTANYVYDGDGKRVMKSTVGGATTTYVYDASGNLTAEYSTASNPDSGTVS